MTNILILSCGTRNKIVQYMKQAVAPEGKVFAADCHALAPALYEADDYFIIPRIDEPDYIDVVLSICEQYKISAVLSLLDPELSLLATHKEAFLAIGTIPIVADAQVITRCFNKYSMYEFLIENGFRAVKSYQELALFERDLAAGMIDFPVFVKPICGSASVGAKKVSSYAELALYCEQGDYLIQPFIEAEEYGADVYVDLLTKKCVAMFVKQKLAMRAGETEKAVSVRDESLFPKLARFVEQAGLVGMVDIDLFKIGEHYIISEVNPRFGGGYPHAYESGVQFPQMLVQNLQGHINENVIGQYEADIYMMKYNEVTIQVKNKVYK